ncbi:MAG TPA: hypothetical protein VIR38_00325, partial [Thalassobaculum sp.]
MAVPSLTARTRPVGVSISLAATLVLVIMPPLPQCRVAGATVKATSCVRATEGSRDEMTDGDSIVALATVPGRAGIAVV